MSLGTLKHLIRKSPSVEKLALAAQAKAIWLNWYLRRPAVPKTTELQLHLGCGEIDAPGFVNVDGRPMPHVHFVQPLHDLSTFSDNSASLIYASHCLEHFPNAELPGILAEWCRVLRPGGVLRLAVPDFDALVDMYLDQSRELEGVQRAIMGGQDYAFNFHYVVLNEKLLSSLLQQAGFGVVRRWRPGNDGASALPDWSGRPINHHGKDYFISLNMEGVKS